METNKQSHNQAEIVNDKKWLERVQVVQIIYSYLIECDENNPTFSPDQFLHETLQKYRLSADQVQILDYAIHHGQQIMADLITPNLKTSWSIDRLNLVNLAILIEADAEGVILKTPKEILIDQSIITCKRFCDVDDYRFINALLDKILK